MTWLDPSPVSMLDELRERADEARRQFTDAFHAKVDQLVAWAGVFGYDMAISDGDPGDGEIKFWWMALEPGVNPPLGRRWSVIHCGGHEPPHRQHPPQAPPGETRVDRDVHPRGGAAVRAGD